MEPDVDLSGSNDKKRFEGCMLDDDVLVQRAAAGDADAYQDLVIRYQDVALRTAYLITGEATAAQDAAQEGFLRAYRALSRFRAGNPVRPWLLKIVANEARRRRSSFQRDTLLALRVVNATASFAEPSVESEVLIRERRQSLHNALMKLTEADQQVIAYRYVLDLSEGEMAEVMDCPRGTVKSRLSRAIERLRTVLTVHDVELLDVGSGTS